MMPSSKLIQSILGTFESTEKWTREFDSPFIYLKHITGITCYRHQDRKNWTLMIVMPNETYCPNLPMYQSSWVNKAATRLEDCINQHHYDRLTQSSASFSHQAEEKIMARIEFITACGSTGKIHEPIGTPPLTHKQP